ncbi:CHRD domain-containing protein [Herbaspirillum sp. HC18]|nr:CHRD domain-containing protein [Herbaspirillum sp. HC18]
MSFLHKVSHLSLVSVVAVVLLNAGCSSMSMPSWAGGTKAGELTGAQEIPPVTTKASGNSTIKVADDKSVSGAISFSGMQATAAHIHQGAMGANGPVIIPLTKTSDTGFAVPANAKLTEAQYTAYKAGGLYVNVHSAAHPGGEIRMQLKP